ncbi:unnamed protein product, partial [Agarophyton chilense]
AALPACAGLAAAVRLALARRFCVRWTVDAVVLEAAGVAFVRAAFDAGFVPRFDEEDPQRVVFVSNPNLSDAALRRLLLRLRHAADHDVLPAGEAALTELARQPHDDDEPFNCADLLAYGHSAFYPQSNSKL